MQTLFLEDPAPVIGALVIVGVILLIVARQRRSRQSAIIAIVAFALAVGGRAMSEAVETSRERLMQRCEQLVDAAGPVDVAKLTELFEPDATLIRSDGRTEFKQATAIALKVQKSDERFSFIEHEIIKLMPAISPGEPANRAQTTIDVRTKLPPEVYGKPVQTVWQIQWRLGTDGRWRIMKIKWLKLEGQTPHWGIWN